jgi:haloalkane dehalogenase
VHGNPTWSFYYRDLVRELRDDFRVVVPDHIGCGLASRISHSSWMSSGSTTSIWLSTIGAA